MQVFGVDVDVDALGRRKRVSKPKAVATLAEVHRRAASYGDIVDISGKKRFPKMPSDPAGQKPSVEDQAFDVDGQPRRCRAAVAGCRGRVACGILPADAESYDVLLRRRAFFDGPVHAEHYARLLGRPGVGPKEEDRLVPPSCSALGDLEEGQLPLHVRRVLEALLPGKSDAALRGLHPEVFDRVCAQVEDMVLERLYARAPRRRRGGATRPTAVVPVAAASAGEAEGELVAKDDASGQAARAACMPNREQRRSLPTLLSRRFDVSESKTAGSVWDKRGVQR